jgi:peptidoglycan/LPS O-acetylase OafA/YrhL
MSVAAPPSIEAGDRPISAAAPEVVAPPPGHPRFPLMDSLRALAALGVIFTHVAIATGTVQKHSWGAYMGNLDVGVSIFFVLSGFLLYRPFFNSEMTAAPRPRVWDYTRRRVLRIVPAYWLALTLLAIYPGLGGVFTSDWWRYYGFLQIYNPYTALAGLSVAWTLCIEVTFYAILPLYAAATRRLARHLTGVGRIRLQLSVLALLGVASVVLRAVDQDTVMQNSLLTHFDWFALGMALAVLSVAFEGDEDAPRLVRLVAMRPGLCWMAALATYIVMCVVLTDSPMHLYYSISQSLCQHVLRGAVATLMVIPAVFGWRAGGWPRAVLSWRLLAWLGIISYGLYLWHEPINHTLVNHGVAPWWLVLAITLALTTACAAVSYYVVERPVMRLKNPRSRARSEAVAEAGLAGR